MPHADLILLSELANELGMDRSHARKFALANGFAFVRIRSHKTRGSKALALNHVDAERFRRIRIDEYRSGLVPAKDTEGIRNDSGYLYMVQLIPDMVPYRIKLGYASNLKARLQDHRTAAPTAELYASWACLPTWEMAAISSMTRTGCTPLSNEVFDCDSVEDTRLRGESFFALMPSVSQCVAATP